MIKADVFLVKNVEVNQGVTLKRFRARARGSASPINKRPSNIAVTLVEKEVKTKAPKKTSGQSKKTKVETKENNSKKN